MNIHWNKSTSSPYVYVYYYYFILIRHLLLLVIWKVIVMFQVSFLLGVIPIFVAWVYSEFLEYQKSPLLSKVWVIFFVAHYQWWYRLVHLFLKCWAGTQFFLCHQIWIHWMTRLLHLSDLMLLSSHLVVGLWIWCFLWLQSFRQ